MTASTFTFAVLALSAFFAVVSVTDALDISATEHNSYDCSSTCKSRSKAIKDCAYRPNCELKACVARYYEPYAKCVPKPSVTPTSSPSVSPSSSPSVSVTPSSSPSVTPSSTPSASATPSSTPSVSPSSTSSPTPEVLCPNKCTVAYKAKNDCQYKPGCKVVKCGRKGHYGPYLAKCTEDKVECPNKCTYTSKANKECKNLTGCVVTDCHKNKYGKTLSKCGPAPKY